MHQFRFHPAVIVCLLASAAVAADEKEREKNELVGTWRIVSVRSDGTEAAENLAKDARVIFSEKEVSLRSDGQDQVLATYTADMSTDPMVIDFVREDAETKKKTTIEGIFAFEEGKLKLCVQPEDAAVKQRPSKFSAEAGEGLLLLVLARED